jgi:hypothetical protein
MSKEQVRQTRIEDCKGLIADIDSGETFPDQTPETLAALRADAVAELADLEAGIVSNVGGGVGKMTECELAEDFRIKA